MPSSACSTAASRTTRIEPDRKARGLQRPLANAALQRRYHLCGTLQEGVHGPGAAITVQCGAIILLRDMNEPAPRQRAKVARLQRQDPFDIRQRSVVLIEQVEHGRPLVPALRP